jgi:clan AA aspartic protease
LAVRGPSGGSRIIEAVIDTGFSGFLTLPSSIIVPLGLIWRGEAQAILGDGRRHQFDVYSATVEWDGRERHVEVDVAETSPLVGMGLLAGHDLCIEAVAGGKVSIGARKAKT